MSKETALTGKDILEVGFTEGKAVGVALKIVNKYFRRESKADKIEVLRKLLANPENFLEKTNVLQPIAFLLTEKINAKKQIELNTEKISYKIYGKENIENEAVIQMDIAMRLPITVAGALMPDAHYGYGLPIGGVLAAENAIIPYGVGMDIGCRMCLSVYDLREKFFEKNKSKLKNHLRAYTKFGGEETFENPMDDAIFSRPEFREIKLAQKLRDRAYKQIGTSGSGNHFVEFGMVEIVDPNNEFSLPVGNYLGILSHSGSRSLGASIAEYYTKIAIENCLLPKEAQHLAWLSLDSEAGNEYWRAMNLAGDYASACHHQIHKRLAEALGETHLAMVENHHNFAWKEQLSNGKEVIVHRKGATPAGKGVLGIIPGSMTSAGYIVRGKGESESLNSASHGAGRAMSRRKAMASITQKDLKQILDKFGVELIGAGLDEAPMAYKNIEKVMSFQESLVEVVGKFQPKIVRMDGN
ncbi:MAG: RtcB family protein [Bacteroidetes bacterium]|nr:MAG: RtcB family protein [Bacteroidota bacterium]